MRNKGSSTITATGTTDESPSTPGRSETQIGPPTRLDETLLIEEVPTLVRSVAELQNMDLDMAAFVAEHYARDIREQLAAADSGKANQVNKTGKSKKDDRERVRRVRNETATMFDKANSVSDFTN